MAKQTSNIIQETQDHKDNFRHLELGIKLVGAVFGVFTESSSRLSYSRTKHYFEVILFDSEEPIRVNPFSKPRHYKLFETKILKKQTQIKIIIINPMLPK